MKKIIMLLLLVILLTGCSANVNLTITSSTIEEEVIVNAYSDSTTTKQQVYSKFKKYIPVFVSSPMSDTEPDVKQTGIEYYTRKVQDLGSGYSFIYDYKYNFDDYKNARTVALGFDSKTIQRDPVEKTIMISTDSSGLNFFDQYSSLESVTVNIKTNYQVKENNADVVNGNTYTWVLRKGTKKSIYMLINDPNAGTSYDKKEEESKEEQKDEQEVVVPTTPSEPEEENEIVEYANNHPIIVGVVAIFGFFILVLILAKASKIKN